jgi:hypothetical protein
MKHVQRYTIRHKDTGLWWTGSTLTHWAWSDSQRNAIGLHGEDIAQRELDKLAGSPVELVPPLQSDETAGLPLFAA